MTEKTPKNTQSSEILDDVVAKNVAYFLFNSWLSFRRFCRLLWGYIVVKVIIGYHTAKTVKNQLAQRII